MSVFPLHITAMQNIVVSNYDDDYQAILNYATANTITKPSTAIQDIQNQLVIDLKTAGIWSKLDVLHIFTNDGNDNFSYINWINPNLYYVTENNTGYNPSTDAINYTLNEASFGYKRNNNVASWGTDAYVMRSGIDGITQTGGGLWLYDQSFGGKVYLNNEINERFGNTYRFISSTENIFLVINRVDSNNIHLYQDGGYLTDTETIAPSVGLPPYDLIYNANILDDIHLTFVGGKLTTTEIEDFNTAINTYLNSI